jgi:hypothetical protein
MSPIDIAATADFRTGLFRRLAELGLVPPESAQLHVAPLPDSPAKAASEDRKAA